MPCQAPRLEVVNASGQTGPLPDRLSSAAMTVSVQPESTTSSTRSTGPLEHFPIDCKDPVKVAALVESVLLCLLKFVVLHFDYHRQERKAPERRQDGWHS